ncbi:phosphoribosylamine--glycine ligase [Candidatus Parcubacteria bacterium]|nr:phosphoribosylamine--glycine ligase [Candidatus Parcubacteria bacterium]
MKILVIGGGGREHALVEKIAHSPKVGKIFCAPGNAGIAKLAECVPIEINDISNLVTFAQKESIDLTIVGPEAPLANGIVDLFEENGLRIFGPTQRAAAIESSKAFAKELMSKCSIPTAEYEVFSDFNEAFNYIQGRPLPIVIKADGLAAGKGVKVAMTYREAADFLKDVMLKKIFGSAGDKVVIEEYLRGEEVSVIAFTDGKTSCFLPPAQDYKAAYNGNQGPNTGGMGSYAPVTFLNSNDLEQIKKRMLSPLLKGMARERVPFKGIIYLGLIMTENGPMVMEINCRGGDPESTVTFSLLESDIVDIFEAVISGRPEEIEIKWSNKKCVCVVLASEGYPGDYKTGMEIFGLEKASSMKDVMVFHSGTARKGDKIVTAGGRVLEVAALGDSYAEAVKRAYKAVGRISFKGMQFRKDIARKVI